MLKLMRKNTKTIIWLVIITFMLWGGYAVSTQFQKQGRIAGEIFGKEITYQEFNTFYRSNQIFSFAGKKPPEDSSVLNLQTWQSLIYAYEARNQKVKITDDEVREEIMRLLKDQKIENPSPQFYERWLLSSFGFRPNEFEKQLRELLSIQKLVRQFNEAVVAEPSKADIQERFEHEHNSLNLDLVEISKPDEAKAFYDKVKANPSAWDAQINAHAYKVQTTGKIALDAVINLWQIPKDTASGLLKQPVGFITPPFQRFNAQSLARIKGKELADEKKFTAELKKQYGENLKNQKKYERFLKWNGDLETRANLKDYTPKPPAAKPVPEESSSSPKVTTAPAGVSTKTNDTVSKVVQTSQKGNG
ncbi:MAG: hypothetical protein EXS63_03270 [Candidatus Omnitrophica bacterium]|nr:hypothetical protein [Candidatus Omnitrophota bacterium]